MVVGVIGFDKVSKDYVGVLVVLASEVKECFEGEVPVLASRSWCGSVLVFCSMFFQEFVASGTENAAECFGACVHEGYHSVFVGVIGVWCFGDWGAVSCVPFGMVF